MKRFVQIGLPVVFLFLIALVHSASAFHPVNEFQELAMAVVVNGQRTWKVMGPDLNGSYGGLNGVGGLEVAVLID